MSLSVVCPRCGCTIDLEEQCRDLKELRGAILEALAPLEQMDVEG